MSLSKIEDKELAILLRFFRELCDNNGKLKSNRFHSYCNILENEKNCLGIRYYEIAKCPSYRLTHPIGAVFEGLYPSGFKLINDKIDLSWKLHGLSVKKIKEKDWKPGDIVKKCLDEFGNPKIILVKKIDFVWLGVCGEQRIVAMTEKDSIALLQSNLHNINHLAKKIFSEWLVRNC